MAGRFTWHAPRDTEEWEEKLNRKGRNKDAKTAR
jgi:hypothetical protein